MTYGDGVSGFMTRGKTNRRAATRQQYTGPKHITTKFYPLTNIKTNQHEKIYNYCIGLQILESLWLLHTKTWHIILNILHLHNYVNFYIINAATSKQ